jgi:hypothetical protein
MVGAAPTPWSTCTQTPRSLSEAGCATSSDSERRTAARAQALLVERLERRGREEAITLDGQPEVPADALQLLQAEVAVLERDAVDETEEGIVAVELRRVPRPGAVGGEELHVRHRSEALLVTRPQGRQ